MRIDGLSRQRSTRLAAILGALSGSTILTGAACGSKPAASPSSVVEVAIVSGAPMGDAGVSEAGLRGSRHSSVIRPVSTVPVVESRPPDHNTCYSKSSYEDSECLSRNHDMISQRINTGNGINAGPVEVQYPDSTYVECCYHVDYYEEEPPQVGRPLVILGRPRSAKLVSRDWC